MSSGPARREVRVAEGFFEMLDLQTGAERGPGGEPSATDFLVIGFPEIVEVFATDFDGLAEAVAGVPSGRVYIGAGALVTAVAVYGVELDDGAVELIGIEIDP
ncbi:MAG: hypothetical protein GY925_21995 [Actinomycetia bacterium]|nr:hypothetical protein [Actinomycetes bacterium]